MAKDNSDAAKLARARAIAREAEAEEAALREQYAECKRVGALVARFRKAGAAEVLRMWESCTSENGEPLTQFEFEALCERWCIVFGEPPPTCDPADIATEPEPLPDDDEMLSMKKVVRIAGLSKSTIKRRVSDPTDDFPKPVKLSTRRIGWPAELVKAWRKRIESAGSDRSH
jgi:predicted DNA-binding transcriptional regulator AlpA